MELPEGYLEREAAYDDGYAHGYEDGWEQGYLEGQRDAGKAVL